MPSRNLSRESSDQSPESQPTHNVRDGGNAGSGVPGSSAVGSTFAKHSEHRGGSTKRLKVHGLEIALLIAVSAHLVFLPWALGTMRLWAQWISLGFAVLTFALALVPRYYNSEHTGGASYRYLPWRKLIRFPIFWLGLALLALVVCHGLNPAWVYVTDGKMWWMKKIPHITWLPHGVEVPFKIWGPWRTLIVYTSAFLTVCSLWIGFTRRTTLRALFFVLAINGVLLAITGLVQRSTGAGKILWSIPSPNPAFFASFIYKNHAGAYLNLSLTVCCALAVWSSTRALQRFQKSNPSGVFAIGTICIAAGILLSLARGATFSMLGLLALTSITYLVARFRAIQSTAGIIGPAVMIAILAAFAAYAVSALNAGLAWERLAYVFSGNDSSVLSRQSAAKATFDAIKDNGGLGIGSGSFRFLFPIYQQRYPYISQQQYWEHAHNDLLQIPLEFGIPGTLLIAAGFAYGGVTLLRRQVWKSTLAMTMLIGAFFVVGMSWVDFVFQCPAVLITWLTLWPAWTIWRETELHHQP